MDCKLWNFRFLTGLLCFTFLISTHFQTSVYSQYMPHSDDHLKRGEYCAVFDLVKHIDATHVAIRSGNGSRSETWQDNMIPAFGT